MAPSLNTDSRAAPGAPEHSGQTELIVSSVAWTGPGRRCPKCPGGNPAYYYVPPCHIFIVGCIFLPGPAYPAPDGRCYMLSLTPDSHCYNHVTCHTIGGGGKVSCVLILSLRYLHTQSRVTRSQYNSRCNLAKKSQEIIVSSLVTLLFQLLVSREE